MNTTFFNMPKHKLIGHRGVAGLRPENTYCSFAYAKDLGLNWIEFDILLTSDQKWVVMHDDSVDRTTNGHGLVREMTLEQLELLEAGLWFSPPYPSQKIPTLEGVLRQARQLQLICNIEIKGADLTPEHHAKLLVEFLLQQTAINLENIIISSFSLACLIKIRELLPTIKIAYLIEQFTADTITIAQRYKFMGINCNVRKITQDDIIKATAAQIPIFLYTVNQRSIANFWLEKGIAGLFTDRPDLLITQN